MFVVIGALGALLLLVTLIFDDVIDDVIPGVDFITGPVIGAFLVAFGAFGRYLDAGPDVPLLPSLLIALVAGVGFGALARRLTRMLANQPTDGHLAAEKSAQLRPPPAMAGNGNGDG